MNYEVFHSRMLAWLWSVDAEHGCEDRFLRPLMKYLDIGESPDHPVRTEVKIEVPNSNRWRLGDIVLRTPKYYVLVENKVDPGYQDKQQIEDEIEGGRRLGELEGRKFVFVLVAPGPLQSEILAKVESAGRFLSWNDLVAKFREVSLEGVDSFTEQLVRQYLDFMDRPTVQRSGIKTTDGTLELCENAITELIGERTDGSEVTAVELWERFVSRFPDFVSALDDRYAETSHYSAKSWFSSGLQNRAANRRGLEDTGEWRSVAGALWSYPKVRIYRRIAH